MLISSPASEPEPSAIVSAPADTLNQDCVSELHSLMQKSPAIRFACLSLTDGRPFAFVGTASSKQAPRIAAITASFLALGESFAREGENGHCTHTTISSDGGTIIVMKVAARTCGMALSISADRSENLATVLRRTLDTAEFLARRIDS